MKKLKKIFVASSKESRPLAEEVSGILEDINDNYDEYEIQAIPWWKYNVFVTGQMTLNEILRAATECDAGIFVLGINDCVKGSREDISGAAINDKETKQETYIVSSNVLIEAGMFYGMKDPGTVCLFTDTKVPTPSDLNGITRIIYKENKENKIRAQIKEWIKNLENHEGKYVLADSHGINNVKPVFVTNKNHIENALTLQERTKNAKEIRLLNYAGSSFLSNNDIAKKYDESWNIWFSDALKGQTTFTIILTDPNSPAATEAAKYKMYPQGGLKVAPGDIIYSNIEKIKKLYDDNPNINLFSYITDISLPYAIFETTFVDPMKDHIKVDLYSPLTFNDEKRPSFMIYRKDNEALYQHFSSVIDNIIFNENTKRLVVNNMADPQTNFHLKKNIIDSAIQKEYRQYFIGKLARPQILDYLEQGDLEIGTSLYREPKADTPHMHSKTSEILYILKGIYKILDIDKNEEYILNEGDFFVLPPKTPYASKANADTQVLFVKTGGNDKMPIEISERVKIWIGDLNE